MIDQSLAERVALLEGELEVRRRFGRYSSLYGPMAVLSVALSFLPLLGDVTQRDPDGSTMTWRYGTLWQMAGNSGGGPAALGVLVLISFVALLVVAAANVRSESLPVAIAVHAAVLVLMLLTKPGTGEPTPPLTDAGVADVALLCAAAVTAVAHAVQLRRWRAQPRRNGTAPVSVTPEQAGHDDTHHHGRES